MATGPGSAESGGTIGHHAGQHANRCALAILAKAPVAGYAKTRLIQRLGAAGAARLQRWLIERTVQTALAAGFGRTVLWCAPAIDHPVFVGCRDRFGVTLQTQPAGDLGERMLQALQPAAGMTGTVLIGTDCPLLTPDILVAACRAIDAGSGGDDAAIRRGKDGVVLVPAEDGAVLVPAEDGGYGLIALRRARAELFREIDWGTSRVLAQTRQRAQAAGIRLTELAACWDVDRPEDYDRLLAAFPALDRIVAGE